MQFFRSAIVQAKELNGYIIPLRLAFYRVSMNLHTMEARKARTCSQVKQ